jgi:hypothetical protein
MKDLSTSFVTKQHSLYVHDLNSYLLGDHNCIFPPKLPDKYNSKKAINIAFDETLLLLIAAIIEFKGKVDYNEWNW